MRASVILPPPPMLASVPLLFCLSAILFVTGGGVVRAAFGASSGFRIG